jgi:hypothetical protein
VELGSDLHPPNRSTPPSLHIYASSLPYISICVPFDPLETEDRASLEPALLQNSESFVRALLDAAHAIEREAAQANLYEASAFGSP